MSSSTALEYSGDPRPSSFPNPTGMMCVLSSRLNSVRFAYLSPLAFSAPSFISHFELFLTCPAASYSLPSPPYFSTNLPTRPFPVAAHHLSSHQQSSLLAVHSLGAVALSGRVFHPSLPTSPNSKHDSPRHSSSRTCLRPCVLGIPPFMCPSTATSPAHSTLPAAALVHEPLRIQNSTPRLISLCSQWRALGDSRRSPGGHPTPRRVARHSRIAGRFTCSSLPIASASACFARAPPSLSFHLIDRPRRAVAALRCATTFFQLCPCASPSRPSSCASYNHTPAASLLRTYVADHRSPIIPLRFLHRNNPRAVSSCTLGLAIRHRVLRPPCPGQFRIDVRSSLSHTRPSYVHTPCLKRINNLWPTSHVSELTPSCNRIAHLELGTHPLASCLATPPLNTPIPHSYDPFPALTVSLRPLRDTMR